MNEQNTVVAVVVSATIIAITLVLQSKIEKWLDLKERQFKNQAVYECGLVATVKWQDNQAGAQVSEPYKQAYQQCLKDKGY